MRRASLHREALTWMTALLAVVGVVAVAVSFGFAYSEAADFLDSQLRQIALSAGGDFRAMDAPPAADQDPEDDYAISIFAIDGTRLHSRGPPTNIGLGPVGFADVSSGGEEWRVYTAKTANSIVQAAQRQRVRDEIAQGAALSAAAPVLVVIPLSWLVLGWAITRFLRKLDALVRDLSGRGAEAEAPIAAADAPVEIMPLIDSMNGLILRLRKALEAQKRFLADAAHELRTPLAAIQIHVDALGAQRGEPHSENIGALVKSARRASSLIGQLLRLARLDNLEAPKKEAIDLKSLLIECVADLAPVADAKGVDLGAALGDAPTCEGSADELRTLFVNLIENAVRYTPANGRVDVDMREDRSGVAIDVLDTGPGIPNEALPRLFDRFFRADPSQGAGSGLGLAIARQICARHGFELTVGNRADGLTGALAHVSVPRGNRH